MLRYNLKTGVAQSKRNIKKYLISGTAALLGVGAVAIPALAAGPGYSPPPAVANICDASHGAFAAFSNPSLHGSPGNYVQYQPPYFGDPVLGSARAGVTGVTNSGASQTCNQTP
jgi:hypothetical protein